MYLLGYDLGSSSIKAALVDAVTQRTLAVVQSPKKELEIEAPKVSWAEQDPEIWWQHIRKATKQLLKHAGVQVSDIQGIGIAYQMHGLILVDKNQNLLRPAIIWCDSRAVEIGDAAFQNIGTEKCLTHLLNSPANFTASKLKWVQENEPDIYAQIHKVMLPGDYIAMKLTGEITTTISGLSEGVLWNFKENKIADLVLNHYGIAAHLLADIRPTCSLQGKVTAVAAGFLGLKKGIPVTYRAGDQPNNALCLHVLKAGEVAATGGTSGVVYGIVDQPIYDFQSRVNSFAHVNYTTKDPKIGVLLCINGAGIQYAWMKQQIAQEEIDFKTMEEQAASVPIGAEGVRILPFGNGAERMLKNRNIGAQIINLQFTQHTRAHLYRASLEGIAFAFVYGMQILQEMGLDISVMRVGNDNLFQSPIFANTIATLMNTRIDVIETTGAVGAAKAAGVAIGYYKNLEEAMKNLEIVKSYRPQKNKETYTAVYSNWKTYVEQYL